MVFKCRWPSLFGPSHLLAIKMLSDKRESQASLMAQAFRHEVNVLSRCT